MKTFEELAENCPWKQIDHNGVPVCNPTGDYASDYYAPHNYRQCDENNCPIYHFVTQIIS